jgi:hypothetical protein
VGGAGAEGRGTWAGSREAGEKERHEQGLGARERGERQSGAVGVEEGCDCMVMDSFILPAQTWI